MRRILGSASNCGLTIAIAAPLALALTCPAPAAAQVAGDYPTIGVTPVGDCGSPPSAYDPISYVDAPGTYDFWIYPIVFESFGQTSAVHFGFGFPAEWSLVSTEVCAGTLTELTELGSSFYWVEIDYGEDWPDATAALRVTVDASTPGEMKIGPDPVSTIEYFMVPGGWTPREIGLAWATVGPLAACQRQPLSEPGDFCGLGNGRMNPGHVSLPPALSLAANTVYVEEVPVIDNALCYTGPCVEGFTVECIDWIWSDVPWVYFDAVPYQQDLYELHVDTTGLPAGTHEVNVQYGGHCPSCRKICVTLPVTVGPVPVEAVSWGRIKAIHRD